MKSNLDWPNHKTVLHEPASMLITPDEIVIEREWLKGVCDELRAARELCHALVKARLEEYCNVPSYVDDAIDAYEKAAQ